jgi:hypothetical protein
VTVAEWLETRTPPAPSALAERLRSALGEGLARDATEAPGVLLAAAEHRLGRFIAGGTGPYGDALELLAIDALVTYAFEAAADGTLAELDDRARDGVARIAALVDGLTGAPEGVAAP